MEKMMVDDDGGLRGTLWARVGALRGALAPQRLSSPENAKTILPGSFFIAYHSPFTQTKKWSHLPEPSMRRATKKNRKKNRPESLKQALTQTILGKIDVKKPNI